MCVFFVFFRVYISVHIALTMLGIFGYTQSALANFRPKQLKGLPQQLNLLSEL